MPGGAPFPNEQFVCESEPAAVSGVQSGMFANSTRLPAQPRSRPRLHPHLQTHLQPHLQPHHIILLLLASIAALAQGAHAATGAPREVAAVLTDPLPGAEQRCAYTRVRSDADSLKIERYDPRDANGPWSLLNRDGHEPTVAELRRYRATAGNRTDRRHPLAFDPRAMVRPSSWRLRSDDGDEVVYEFRLRPFEELDERIAEKAIGTLTLNRRDGRLLRIRIENTEPAFPAPLVRVTSYAQELRFERDAAIGTDVLVESVMHLRGRALGVKALSEDRVITYRDYVCAPSVQAAR
jgi:hypothetical protein